MMQLSKLGRVRRYLNNKMDVYVNINPFCKIQKTQPYQNTSGKTIKSIKAVRNNTGTHFGIENLTRNSTRNLKVRNPGLYLEQQLLKKRFFSPQKEVPTRRHRRAQSA